MKQIFILEDDDSIREMIAYLLSSKGYEVHAFPNAGEFGRSIKLQKPDLILMDIMLPDGNGLEICKNLHDDKQTKDIPVILMSAHSNDSVSKENCARDFIAKPFDIEDLLKAVGKQLN